MWKPKISAHLIQSERIIYAFFRLLTALSIIIAQNSFAIRPLDSLSKERLTPTTTSSRKIEKKYVVGSIPVWSTFSSLNDVKLEEIGKTLPLRSLNLGSHISGPTLRSRKVLGAPDADLWLGSEKQAKEFKVLYQSYRVLAFLDSITHFKPEVIPQIIQFDIQKNAEHLIHPTLITLLKKGQDRLKAEKELSENSIKSFQNIAKVAIGMVLSQIKNTRSQGIDLSKGKRLLVVTVAAELQGDNPKARSIDSFGTVKEKILPGIMQFLDNTELPPLREITAPWLDSIEFDLEPKLDLMNDVVYAAHLRNYIVYIHCNAGISRSATLVIDYLIHHGDFNEVIQSTPNILFDIAYSEIESQRPEISPNYTFARTLEYRTEEMLRQLGIYIP